MKGESMNSSDYLLEKRLRELDPDLHRRLSDNAVVCRYMLKKFKHLFPEYTDHSLLHSLTVIEACNNIIGEKQIYKLNGDEIFVLLMSCYLHDSGMGISRKDYDRFKDQMGEKEYFEKHPDDTISDFVRTYHNEFSGLFITRYAKMFDIPSEEHLFAIRQVSRGHRKTDLFDETEYPAAYRMPDGNTVCVPYLAALIRLADEVDVVASRNPMILYDIEIVKDEFSLLEHRKLDAVKSMEMTESEFILHAESDDEKVLEGLRDMVSKMQKTLDLCREVVEIRTPFSLSQNKVILVNHSPRE